MEGHSQQRDYYQQEWVLLQKEKEIIEKEKEIMNREKEIMTLKLQIEELKQSHAKELRNIDDVHCRNIAKIIDRYQSDLIKAKADSIVNQKLLEEKNNLAKTCHTMKILVDTMMKYFVIREDEADKMMSAGIFRDERSADSDTNDKVVETDENVKMKTNNRKESQEYNYSLCELKIQRFQDSPSIVDLVASGSSNMTASQNIEGEPSGRKVVDK